ncbi:MAG: rane protein [Candidatus Eremiobacteraeota bacterium]|nr:rane protein [Candidatus Eremiobacteraeota bacterium]
MEMINKVPRITVFFWIIKVFATTVGETAADFLATKLGFGLSNTAYIMSGVFLIALLVQLNLKKYVPGVYWTVVVLISVVGTLLADLLVNKLGVGLSTSSIIFAVLLAAVFFFWWRSEKTLSVHKIHTTRRELFYWAAILFTFALGTSAGDLVSEAFGLGYGTAAVIFAAAIAVTAFAYFVLKVDGVLAFWIAYILTRPLGASMGDLLAQPVKDGGMGLGTTSTSVVFFAVIAGLVVYLTFGRKDELTQRGLKGASAS